MKLFLRSVLFGFLVLLAQPAAAIVHQRTFSFSRVPDVQTLRYGISVPDDYNPDQARPLVLALHPGGERLPFYGSRYLSGFFMAPLKGLGAIVVAPDCPTRTWTDAGAEQAVMALLEEVLREYTIDRRRILVTGYSMGGRGTWFMSSRHADFFTAAITIAGSPEGQPLDSLGRIPTYAIHSRNVEVVPLGPDQRVTEELDRLGRPVKLEVVGGGGHYDRESYMEAFGRAVHWVEEHWQSGQRSAGR